MSLGPMVTPTIGWNFGAGFTRTTDGGAHWTDVTPPGLGDHLYVDYLDPVHAWIIQDLGNQVVTFQTRDAGKSWQHGAPVTGETVDAYGIGGIQVDFVDPSHGWRGIGSRRWELRRVLRCASWMLFRDMFREIFPRGTARVVIKAKANALSFRVSIFRPGG